MLLGSAHIPYVKGTSGKFKHIENRYITTIFKTKHTFGRPPSRIRPERDMRQTAYCLYSIPCERGRIGETGRPLAVQFR
jgi:hypothetical protein